MAKHYKYVNGKKMVVINNYDLGSDLIPDEIDAIPDITVADIGKVLTVDENGEPVWDDVPEELPALAGNGGKVLKVNSGATGVEWANESTELPSLTDNAGKVLTVNSGETGVEWAAPSGDGGTLNVFIDFNDTLDKTVSEIWTALNNNTPVYIWGNTPPEYQEIGTDYLYGIVLVAQHQADSPYTIVVCYMNAFWLSGQPATDIVKFTSQSESGYPTLAS